MLILLYAFYQACRDLLMQAYHTDLQFKQLLQEDAASTYTLERADKFPNKDEYIQKTIDDLLEQCVYGLIAPKKGYKFDFYPGKQYSALHYVNEHMLPVEKYITHVHVSISFEKK